MLPKLVKRNYFKMKLKERLVRVKRTLTRRKTMMKRPLKLTMRERQKMFLRRMKVRTRLKLV